MKAVKVITASALALAMVSPTILAADAPMSAAQQKQVERVVHDYLLRNPEVLVEVSQILQQKQQQAMQQAAKTSILKNANDMLIGNLVVAGNPKGDVTLIEFFDYNCGYCKKALTDLQKLIDSDKNLRIIIRDFPVLGPDSVEAAIVAVAARQQLSGAKYMEFHAKLLESKGRIGKDRAFSVAKDLNVDLTKLQRDMDLAETKAILSETMQIGDALRLQGTPAYLIGQEVVFGAVGFQSLKDAIDATRKCGKSQCG